MHKTTAVISGMLHFHLDDGTVQDVPFTGNVVQNEES